MTCAGRAHPFAFAFALARDERAVVTIEALLCLLPVLLAFLGAIQLAFLGAARLVVTHGAIAAARSAAVVLDDDPSFYGGEPRGHVGEPARSGGPGGTLLASVTNADPLGLLRASASGGGRLDVIRRAAAAPIAVLTPEPSEVLGWAGAEPPSVRRVLGTEGLRRIAFGLGAYERAALVVAVEPSATEDLVTVRVAYLFHCGVAVAARFSCSRLDALLSRTDDAARALAASFAALRPAIVARSERFRLIESRASYPRQRPLPGRPGT